MGAVDLPLLVIIWLTLGDLFSEMSGRGLPICWVAQHGGNLLYEYHTPVHALAPAHPRRSLWLAPL